MRLLQLFFWHRKHNKVTNLNWCSVELNIWTLCTMMSLWEHATWQWKEFHFLGHWCERLFESITVYIWWLFFSWLRAKKRPTKKIPLTLIWHIIPYNRCRYDAVVRRRRKPGKRLKRFSCDFPAPSNKCDISHLQATFPQKKTRKHNKKFKREIEA